MEEINKKPSIRFAEFTDAWEQRELADLVERVTRKNENNDCNLPLTISAENGLVDQCSFFNNRVASQNLTNYFLLNNGDFAYNKSTSATAKWGAVKRLDLYKNGVLSTLYIVFRPLKINSEYLVHYYETNCWHPEMQKIATEGARNHGLLNISPIDFFKSNIKYPKSNIEQEKIGAIFNLVNNLITLHQRECDQLSNVKKALLEKMFPSDGEYTPKIRFKGFTDAWEQRKLGDIFEFERPDKYMIKDDHYEETGIPVLTANKAFILGYKNETGAYSKGDCIIFDDFTLDSKYVDFPYKINSSVIKILTSKDNSNLKFDFYLLNQAKILQQGHARHYISVVQPTIVNVPKKCESNKIEKLFTNLDSLITLHQRKCEKLKNLKKSLLEKMFI